METRALLSDTDNMTNLKYGMNAVMDTLRAFKKPLFPLFWCCHRDRHISQLTEKNANSFRETLRHIAALITHLKDHEQDSILITNKITALHKKLSREDLLASEALSLLEKIHVQLNKLEASDLKWTAQREDVDEEELAFLGHSPLL